MTKTISINLSKTLFNFNEDAYNHLNTYLDKLDNHFKNSDDKDEIIADIENSIAHKLTLKNFDNQSKAVDSETITQVISEIGTLEDLDDEKTPNSDSDKDNNEYPKNQKLRLYRDMENKLLGGVCAGIAAYFGWEMSIVRVVFIVLVVTGVGLLIPVYIVAWILIPPATTSAQKMEMRGQTLNIASIIDNILNRKK